MKDVLFLKHQKLDIELEIAVLSVKERNLKLSIKFSMY